MTLANLLRGQPDANGHFGDISSCDGTETSSGPSARLINIRWGFASDWVPLHWAIAQFAAHRPDLQDGLALEWTERSGNIARLDTGDVRRQYLGEDAVLLRSDPAP